MLTLPIRNELFWDVDMQRFDQEKNARLVVERVFNYGDIGELKLIIKHYGSERVKALIVQAGYLDRKTLFFASLLFNLPPEDFRCYRKKQSHRTHWN